ncbi:heart- and neural crest derivatives-expressed protein 2 [Caerostris extrusa]|uniref:Heart- and neural crest derivatives-expressed protein 2 n=1 Tax=Caerostris extrusa TaxID=172846 RepID=A0AAV4PGA0_CAEEX|nr:heart- and neural crest derivatives-expressed protein 2 [Caerostris extrusa]
MIRSNVFESRSYRTKSQPNEKFFLDMKKRAHKPNQVASLHISIALHTQLPSSIPWPTDSLHAVATPLSSGWSLIPATSETNQSSSDPAVYIQHEPGGEITSKPFAVRRRLIPNTSTAIELHRQRIKNRAGFKRRVTANRKERRRTLSINNAFAELRECIPNVPSDTKLSKIKTLRLATSYIAYLMDLLAQEDPNRAPQGGFKAELCKKSLNPEKKEERER